MTTSRSAGDGRPPLVLHRFEPSVSVVPEDRGAVASRHGAHCSISKEPTHVVYRETTPMEAATLMTSYAPGRERFEIDEAPRGCAQRRLVSPACDSPRAYSSAIFADDDLETTPARVDDALRETLRSARLEEERGLARLRTERARLEADIERCRIERDELHRMRGHERAIDFDRAERDSTEVKRPPSPRSISSARPVDTTHILREEEATFGAPIRSAYRVTNGTTRGTTPPVGGAKDTLLTAHFRSSIPVTAAVVPSDSSHTMISIEFVVSREEVQLLPANPLDTIRLPIGSLHLLYPFGSMGSRRLLPALSSVVTGVEARRRLVHSRCISFTRLGPGQQHRLFLWWVDKLSGSPMLCVVRFPNRKGFIRAVLMFLHAQNRSSTVTYGRCLWWLAAHLITQARSSPNFKRGLIA